MLKFYELAPSPNNVKVRLALRFKAIPFEVVPVLGDRAEVLAASGQVNTPVIEDRGIVLNDSEAILQYLDANYRDSPRLFPHEKAGRSACDRFKLEWEQAIAPSWRDIFFACIGRSKGFAAESPATFAAVLQEYDRRLGDRDSFHDDPAMSICDLRVAEFAVYGLPGDGLIERCGLFRKFGEQFAVERGRFANLERMLAPWNERLA